LYVNLPVGRVEYVNPFYNAVASSAQVLDYYHAAVAEHVLDFARAVRGEGESEFTDEDALMSMMMLVAINESILRRGERIDLPLRGELESEEREREALRRTYGVDPLDVEGMLDVGIPRA
jgi:hypothetical protein